MFSFPPQVLGVAKVLALETGPRLTPADVSNRESLLLTKHTSAEGTNSKFRFTHQLPVAPYEGENRFR